MKTTSQVVALATTLALFTPALNAETQLNPVVTASRISQSADQTLTAVTVITRRDIEQSQSVSLPDLLRTRVPGMDFLTTGGTGHQTSGFLRGTNSDHLLLLIDGNIIGSATTGAAQLELIPVAQIDRIEVIRGPRSALYGSDAIGGVIQVFTKTGTDSRSASVSFGTENTRELEAQLGFGNEKTRINLSANHFYTEGFNVTNDSEDDKDGYTNNAINFNLNHNVSNDLKLHARWLHSEGETEFDNNSRDNVSDGVQQSFNVGIDSNINDRWRSSFDAGQTRDRLDTLLYTEDYSPTFVPLGTYSPSNTLFDTKRDQLRWQNKVSFGVTGQTAFGVDYIDDSVKSTTTYATNERDNTGYYALVQDKFGNNQLQLSGRLDDNEAFGHHRTANFAWSYDINGAIQSSLSHGTAFIAPTFNDLYFVDPYFIGNPNLKPETSRSTELGFTGNHRWVSWDLRFFHTKIENLIINVSTDPSDWLAPYTTVNANRARIKGVELEIDTELFSWQNNISVAVIDPIDESTNTVLQNRAKRTLKYNISRNFNGHTVTASLLAQSSRYANVTNSIKLAGYAIVNLMIEHPIDKNWRLKTRLENLFNKTYSTSTDFFNNTTNNTPSALFISLHYQH